MADEADTDEAPVARGDDDEANAGSGDAAASEAHGDYADDARDAGEDGSSADGRGSRTTVGLGADSDQDEHSPRVFISYAHEGPEHAAAVRDLWILLRANGVDAVLDVVAAERRQDWPQWMAAELRVAEYVLVVASPEYKRRAEGRAAYDEGRGAQHEAFLIREKIYADRERWFGRVLPVLLPGHGPQDVPDWLGPYSSMVYSVPALDDAGIERLLRVLLGQPYEVEPPIGRRPRLPPRPVRWPRAFPTSSTPIPEAAAWPTGSARPGDVGTGGAQPGKRGSPGTDNGRRAGTRPSVSGPELALTPDERDLLLDELANVFSTGAEADIVLDAVGLLPMRRMRNGTSKIQWSANLRELEKGAVASPYRRILVAALRELPANSVFVNLAKKHGLIPV